jgi:2TM domain
LNERTAAEEAILLSSAAEHIGRGDDPPPQEDARLRTHLLAYLLVNSFLWLVWGVVYLAADGPWFPWPVLPLGG